MKEILRPCEAPLTIPADKNLMLFWLSALMARAKPPPSANWRIISNKTKKNLMLAAGDTFRAAAIEQLQIWGERNQIPVIAQQPGADTAAVIYDAMEAAKARHMDVLIADTAGRLHTQSNLMAELQKVKRVLGKIDPTAPHEVLDRTRCHAWSKRAQPG